MGTVLAADRIKRLQGKEVDEKPLEYWSDKQKEEDDIEEKEALIEKYVTTPKKAPVTQNKNSGMSRGRISLLVFLVVAFFVGTGYGVYVMTIPSDSSGVVMTVNDSAFPVVNNTTTNITVTQNTTKTTVVTNTTKTPTRNTTTPTTPAGNTTNSG